MDEVFSVEAGGFNSRPREGATATLYMIQTENARDNFARIRKLPSIQKQIAGISKQTELCQTYRDKVLRFFAKGAEKTNSLRFAENHRMKES